MLKGIQQCIRRIRCIYFARPLQNKPVLALLINDIPHSEILLNPQVNHNLGGGGGQNSCDTCQGHKFKGNPRIHSRQQICENLSRFL